MIHYLSSTNLKKFKGKTCLLRIDLNIERGEEEHSFRIKAFLPTIKLLLEHGIKVVLISHHGRYGGKGRNKAISLKRFKKIFSTKLKHSVVFIPGFNFLRLNKQIKESKERVFLLENLRFKKEEKINDASFAKKLAGLGDFYVNDAFAVSHRKNASVAAITKHLPSFAGLLLEKEMKNLYRAMKKYKKPLIVVIGGVKASSKIEVMKKFWKKADRFLVGGGVATAFMVAKGLPVGDSIYDKDAILKIKKFIDSKKVFLPLDFKMKGDAIFDIGEITAKIYVKEIKRAKTIIWSGPMGYFEKKEFSGGSEKIARAIAGSKAFSVVGGGETTSLLVRMKLINKFNFVSTGGGAMLAYLAGKKLPGIEALHQKNKKSRKQKTRK